MTELPPVPQASQSPYPLDEPTRQVAAKFEEYAEEETEGSPLTDLLDRFGVDPSAAIGAAVVLGAVAAIAALSFASRNGSRRKPIRKAPKAKASGTVARRKRTSPSAKGA